MKKFAMAGVIGALALSLLGTAAPAQASTSCASGYRLYSDTFTATTHSLGVTMKWRWAGSWCSNGRTVAKQSMHFTGLIDSPVPLTSGSVRADEQTWKRLTSGVLIDATHIVATVKMGTLKIGSVDFGTISTRKADWTVKVGLSPKGYFTYGDGKGKLPSSMTIG